MNFKAIEDFLSHEPSFRLVQVKKLLFKELIEDWTKATILPLSMRDELEKIFNLSVKAETFFSKDKKTVKALMFLEDGLKIESVLMKHKDNRNTVCLSSQVGCPLGCAFCMTGKMGFKRNLAYFEIINQVLFFARLLKKTEEKITNLVFMGMGEPFLNYDDVFKAIRLLNEKDSFNLGARRISISTAGITEGIERMAKEGLEVNLAISLHAPNNKLRSEIMPVTKKYPIEKIFKAVDSYISKTKRRVMFEYLLIKDFNDSKKHAVQLAEIMKKPLYFVNLISYNPTESFTLDGKKFCQPSTERIKKFKAVLEDKNIPVTQRYGFGQDIKGACGQLAS